ncbi:MAG: redoxin domain-containing protein [Candidatus Latescibacteria bacterium]|nr:redoxin domain-containing protein [Candidatus Latescibacterota bacterium]
MPTRFFAFCILTLCSLTPLKAEPLKIGHKLTSVSLTDLNEMPITLSDLTYDRAIILVFNSIVCPASLKYHIHQTQIHNTYGPKGVRIVAVNANFNETNDALQKHYQTYPVPFPIFRDPNNTLADHLGATHTPQAFLFDQNKVLRYRGEIDNGWGVPENTTSRGLWNALDALLANQNITQTNIPSFGCEIRRRPQSAATITPDTPTFHRDILPFLQNRCQSCHRPGGIGRAAFFDYMEVLAWAHQMRDSIDARIMPPWKAQPGYGDFKHSRWLSDKEMNTFGKWVDASMPEGNPTHAPEPIQFPESWALGEPDLILKTEEAYPVEAIGRDEYRCFVLPTNLTKDRFVSAIELLPGEREVVHHVSVYVDVSGKARMLQDLAPNVGYPSFGGIGVPLYEALGGWAPGNTPFILPEGIGRRLPAGSDIVLQIHYHKIGRAVDDQSRLGIYFAKKPVEKRLYEEVINSRLVIIPPNVKNHKFTGTLTIDQDEHALGILPHMHLLGTEMKVTATYPTSEKKVLVWVKPWDFNWQETYVYQEPIALPRGTRITLEAYYDNSSDNPNNPNNPPKLVRWGEESTDEMCTVFLYVTRDNENLLESP